jgi:hypothetical protein
MMLQKLYTLHMRPTFPRYTILPKKPTCPRRYDILPAAILPAERSTQRKPLHPTCLQAQTARKTMPLQPCSKSLVAFTVCPMTGPLPALVLIPAQPLIDSDRALHFTQAALALPPSAAQLQDYFLLQAQAVALRAAPAPAVGSPEPVQVPLHKTCRPIADLANLNAAYSISSPHYCRELQTSYDTPTPSPPRQRTAPRTYLEAAQA